MISIVFFAGMLVLMWVLLIQPQRRRQAQQARLIADLSVGDDVITMGGIHGRVGAIEDESVMLEIAPQTSVRVTKSAIAARVAPETEETPLT